MGVVRLVQRGARHRHHPVDEDGGAQWDGAVEVQVSGDEQDLPESVDERPQLPLVDEPTSALDQERGAAVLDLLTRLTRGRARPTAVPTL